MGWKMYTKLYLFYNGDRTERSPIQSVIIRVFAEETVEWTQIVHVSNCTKWPGGEVVVVGESLATWYSLPYGRSRSFSGMIRSGVGLGRGKNALEGEGAGEVWSHVIWTWARPHPPRVSRLDSTTTSSRAGPRRSSSAPLYRPCRSLQNLATTPSEGKART